MTRSATLRLATCAMAATLLAGNAFSETSLMFENIAAAGVAEHNAGQARTTLSSRTRQRLSRQWRAQLNLRLESAAGDTGLGSRRTFDPLSRPWEIADGVQLEIDSATLEWRSRATRLTFGKQAQAWGVLDGLRVTDRVDPVRWRSFLFTEVRPERIARWGVSLQQKIGQTRWDFVLSPDTTVSQFALPGDTFAPAAPRLRGGLPIDATLPNVEIATPDSPTGGVRLSARTGSSDWTLLAIHGPDTEPVFAATANGVEAQYPTRRLYGATWQRGVGQTVVRAELAYVPDQSVNLSGGALEQDKRKRWLAGIGLDWDLPDGWYLNAQLGVDVTEGERLVGARRDEIVTLRLRRSVANDQWLWEAEVLANAGDGDGTFRPSARWTVNDFLQVTFGADIVWGEPNGLFGQFRERDRLWVRSTVRW